MRALLPILVALSILGLLHIACAPQDVVVATIEDPKDSGVDAPPDGPPPCFLNSECDKGSFCKKSGCDPMSPGVCFPRFNVCSSELHAVCGCSGTSYWNECLSAQNGDNIAADGECADGTSRTCQFHGPGNPQCPIHNSYCSPIGMVDASCPPMMPVAGKCWVVPGKCSATSSDGTRWTACTPDQTCMDTCTAIKSGIAYNIDVGCP